MWRGSLIGVCCALVLVGCQPAPTVVVNPSMDQQSKGLVLSGTATVRVKPTLVVLRLGASFSDASPVASKAQTESVIKKIVAAVKGAGVDADDVQTTAFNLARFEKYENRPAGWKCSSNLEIRVKQVDQAGAVLEAAMTAGANQVSGVEYTVEDLQTVRGEARDAACKVVQEKADQYAQNFGVKLGAPSHIAEITPENWYYGRNAYSNMEFDAMAEASPAQATEEILSSGSVEVKLTVQVTYTLPQ